MAARVEALEVVVGWPQSASVSAKDGRIVVEHDEGRFEIDPATGEPAGPDPRPAAGPSFSRPRETTFHAATQSMWVRGPLRRVASFQLGDVVVGDDERFIVASASYTGVVVTLVDVATERMRVSRVPESVALADVVSGGIAGDLSATVLAAAPDFLVFARTPAMLVVRIADLFRALEDDAIEWHLTTRFGVGDESMRVKAQRAGTLERSINVGRWHSTIPDDVEPRAAVGRLWHPCGWRAVEDDRGRLTPFSTVPSPTRKVRVTVADRSAFASAKDASLDHVHPIVAAAARALPRARLAELAKGYAWHAGERIPDLADDDTPRLALFIADAISPHVPDGAREDFDELIDAARAALEPRAKRAPIAKEAARKRRGALVFPHAVFKALKATSGRKVTSVKQAAAAAIKFLVKADELERAVALVVEIDDELRRLDALRQLAYTDAKLPSPVARCLLSHEQIWVLAFTDGTFGIVRDRYEAEITTGTRDDILATLPDALFERAAMEARDLSDRIHNRAPT